MDKQQGDRLLRLEEALAHLTRVTDDLSGIVARQDVELARLTRRLERLTLAEAERQADSAGTVALADQRPPHY